MDRRYRRNFQRKSLVIHAKTALVSASRFAARLRSARDHGQDGRATWLTIEMRNRYLLMSILALMCGAALASSAFAAEPAAPAQVEHEGVPLKAAHLVQFGKFAVTNSMLVTWIVAAGIIIFAQIATRTIKPIPSGIQNFWEWLVESLYNFLESIIGRELVKKTFWFFATIFIFILFVNWFGLLPGVGTIGWVHYDPTGSFRGVWPLLRGGNADRHTTTAVA